MKFVIATQELNYLINKCLNVVSQRPAIPVLSNILVEAKDGMLTLTSTDLTVGVRSFSEAKVLEEGSTTLPAKKFASLVRELTAINVEVETNENAVTQIKANSSRFKLNGMDPSSYPDLPALADAERFKLSQQELRDMFFRTSFAVSRDEERFTLTGLFLHIENEKATFVGTDGKRLAQTHLDLKIDHSLSGSFIIPLKAVEEIHKNLRDEGEATFYLMHDKIAVETDDSLLITKLLEGDFPDFKRVIPESVETVVSLHREELLTLLRQVSLFSEEEESRSVRFSFSNGELRLSANRMDVGEGKVSMPVNYHGQGMDIAFNPDFFKDILTHTKKEVVNLGFSDPYNPAILTEEDQKPSPSSVPLFVLMPMRLSNE